MSAITAKASRKMKKYAVLTREPRCFLGSFDLSWEQRKAIDIADYSKGNGYSKGDLTDAGTPIILYGRLYTKYQFAISEVDTFAVPRNGAVYSQGNEVIVPASGETAEDIARASAVEKSGVLLGGDLNILRPFDFINPLFLALAISNGEPQKELAKKAQGKSVVHIHNTDIQEVTIAYPSRTEQDRIVSVFRQLDNLITLHQRKCALLFSPFQSFISMMFTTSTFSWEQRKLGDIADIVGGGTPSTGNQSYWDGDIDWYAPAEIADQIYANSSQKKITGLGYENSSAKMLPPGTVLFTSRAGIGKTAILTRKGCTNQGFQSIVPHRGELDSYFIFSRTEELKRYGELVGAGSTFAEVSGKQMAVMELMMPPTMREQQTIGGFFQQLDHLITLHQRKCIFFTGRAGRLISTVNKKRITSSWEQRKFSDITFPAGEKNRDNLPLESYSITNEHGFVPQDEKFENGGTMREADKRMYYIVSPNSFAYNPARINVGSIGYQNIGKNVIVSSLYEVFKTSEDVDDRLLWHWFKSPDFQKLIMQLQEGGVRLYFYYDKLCMGEVSLPSLEEQRKIGKLFDTLDNLITLHQRKPFLMKWRTSDANRNQTNRLVL